MRDAAPRERSGAPPLVLGSSSPRRRALLARLAVPFRCHSPAVEEAPRPGELPDALASRLARDKAVAVAADWPTALVLAADTVVVLDGTVLGKPGTAAEATAMLHALRAREHTVITAICLAPAYQPPYQAALRTRVLMRTYTDSEIDHYVASGDPLDKAGGYGIQHPAFRPVARIVGCYTNVVGLPLCLVAALLSVCGVPTSAGIG
jgi:MAF protein